MGFDLRPRFLALGTLMLLAGCEPAGYWDGIPPPQKLETSERVEDVALAPTGAAAIPETSISRLRFAIAEAQDHGRISIELRVPASADPAVPGRLFEALSGLGIPADRIRLVRSPAEGVILARVRAIRLIVPDCLGVPTDSLGDDTPLSMRRYQLGCASAANFAAMLADPRDLTAPPAAMPGNGHTTELAIEAMNARYGPAAQKKQDSSSPNGALPSSGGTNAAASLSSAPAP